MIGVDAAHRSSTIGAQRACGRRRRRGTRAGRIRRCCRSSDIRGARRRGRPCRVGGALLPASSRSALGLLSPGSHRRHEVQEARSVRLARRLDGRTNCFRARGLRGRRRGRAPLVDRRRRSTPADDGRDAHRGVRRHRAAVDALVGGARHDGGPGHAAADRVRACDCQSCAC